MDSNYLRVCLHVLKRQVNFHFHIVFSIKEPLRQVKALFGLRAKSNLFYLLFGTNFIFSSLIL